ncbi:MAG TPA: glycosyltransferase family 39 protein [Gemmatimonadota bacterium]|nr:glycosyltransferase family 39 protein [Gemmatimonadota bacterium]
MHTQHTYRLLTVCAAIIGFAVILYTTAPGIGVSPDSVTYLEAARSLLDGRGLATTSWAGVLEPMTVYPPMYPVSLATLSLLGLDVSVVARWLNALLFAVNLLLIMFLVRKSSGNQIFPLLAAIFFVSSVTMLLVHSMAWSEPLFLMFSLTGAYLLSVHLVTDRWRHLIAAAAAVALAVLTRYVGVSLVAAGIIALLIRRGRSMSFRLKTGSVFATFALVPAIPWWVRNLGLNSTAPSGHFAFHPVSGRTVMGGLNVLTMWLLPSRVPAAERLILVSVLLAAASAAALIAWKRGGGDLSLKPRDRGSRELLRVLTLYSLAYVILILAVTSVWNADTPIDERILAPLFPAALLVGLAVALQLSIARTGTAVRLLALAGIAALALLYLHRAAVWAPPVHREGLGFNNVSWTRSETVDAVRAMPERSTYSNGPKAILHLTGRRAAVLPPMIDIITGRPNRNYESQLREMEEQLTQSNALVVIFDEIDRSAWLPSETVLLERLRLQLLASLDDGRIYSSSADR